MVLNMPLEQIFFLDQFIDVQFIDVQFIDVQYLLSFFQQTSFFEEEMTSIIKIIQAANVVYTHSPCPDGDTAGFIIKSINPNVILRGWDHSCPPNLDTKELTNQNVMFVDVVPKQLVDICQVAKTVVVPDHHHPNLVNILKHTFGLKNPKAKDSEIFPYNLNTTSTIQQHFVKQFPLNLTLLYSAAEDSVKKLTNVPTTRCACKLLFDLLNDEKWIFSDNAVLHDKLSKFVHVTNLNDTGKYSLMTKEEEQLWLPWSGDLGIHELIFLLDNANSTTNHKMFSNVVLDSQRDLKRLIRCTEFKDLNIEYSVVKCKYSMSCHTVITTTELICTIWYPFYEWLLYQDIDNVRKLSTAVIKLRQERIKYMSQFAVTAMVRGSDSSGQTKAYKCILVKLEPRDLEIMFGLTQILFCTSAAASTTTSTANDNNTTDTKSNVTSNGFANDSLADVNLVLYYSHRSNIFTKQLYTHVSVRQRPGTEDHVSTLWITTSKGRNGGGHSAASAFTVLNSHCTIEQICDL